MASRTDAASAAWLALATALCSASLAQADADARLTLDWQAPAECPTPQALRARLASLHGVQDLSVSGRVQRQAGMYVLELEISSATQRSERSLRATRCEALVQSLLWFVELARSPSTEQPAREAPDVELRKPDATRDVVRAAPLTRDQTQDSARELQLGATVGSAPRSDAGAYAAPASDRARTFEPAPDSLPSPATLRGGVRLAVGAAALGFGSLAPALALAGQLSNASASAELQLTAAVHPDLAVAQGASISMRTWSLGLSVCKEWGERAALSFPCVVGLGMFSSARGEGLRNPQSPSSFWAALGTGARAHLWLHPNWRLSLDVSLLTPISTRPSFEVGDTAARAGQVLAHAHLSAGLRIP